MNSILTQERIKELLHYDPDTGIFTRIVRTSNCVKPGSEPGYIDTCGYRTIGINGKFGKAHRLAFLYMTGKLPEADVDHINGDRADNRWSNLRDVSRSINVQNQRMAHSNNKSGLLGVHRHYGKWQAQIKINGKRIYLGTFPTPDETHAAYIDAKRLIHSGCMI